MGSRTSKLFSLNFSQMNICLLLNDIEYWLLQFILLHSAGILCDNLNDAFLTNVWLTFLKKNQSLIGQFL